MQLASNVLALKGCGRIDRSIFRRFQSKPSSALRRSGGEMVRRLVVQRTYLRLHALELANGEVTRLTTDGSETTICT